MATTSTESYKKQVLDVVDKLAPIGSSNSYCYWTVADGEYALNAQALVHTAGLAGVKADFHVYSNRRIFGAINHDAGVFSKEHYLFKLRFLRERAKSLPYDLLAFLDADNIFVRDPSSINYLAEDGAFVQMENRCDSPRVRRSEWWGLKTSQYTSLIRNLCPKPLRAVYNTNAGFFIVHRERVDALCDLAMIFWEAAKSLHGIELTEEAPLAFAGHVLQSNLDAKTLKSTSSIWATDWTQQFYSGLPDGDPWQFEDYMSGEKVTVNPAIVHSLKIDQHTRFYGQKISRMLSAKDPLEIARRKLKRQRILATEDLVAARQLVCDACEHAKVESGKFEGCLKCACTASSIIQRMKVVGSSKDEGCPKDKWPVLQLVEAGR